MKKFVSVLLCALFVFSAFAVFAFAGDDDDSYAYDTEYYSALKDQNITLYVYNWGEYISDGTDGSFDVTEEFEKLTGIKVEYTTYDSNEVLYSKLLSGSAYYDVIIPSDYMVSRLIQADMLAELDLSNIPNFDKYISEDFKGDNVDYDPGSVHSVPYMWGVVGIIYNKKYVDEADIGSWDLLWNEKYAGKILMFDNSRDAFAAAEELLGYSINTENPDEIAAAAAKLNEQKSVVQAYVMDQIFDKMGEENAWIAPYYAGDYLTMADSNENLGFYFPKEGCNNFVDAMCVLKSSKNKQAAEMFINFMSEPTVSAANAETIGYSTPNTASLELLGEEVTSNEYAYPSEAVIANTEKFKNLSEATNKLMDDYWIKIVRVNALDAKFWIIIAVICVAAVVAVAVISSNNKKRKKLRETV